MPDDAREIRDEIRATLNQEGRIRTNELAIARLSLIPNELRRTEERLTNEIRGSKPGPVWPVIVSLAAVLAVLITLADRLYN